MRLLYATDGSPAAQAAADLLDALGKRAGVDVTAVCVAEEPLAPPAISSPTLLSELRSNAEELVATARSRLEAGRAAERLLQWTRRRRRRGTGGRPTMIFDARAACGPERRTFVRGRTTRLRRPCRASGRAGRPGPPSRRR